ncbi:HepT-like ribonuclease domain-containing protein [Candidatus Protofrankia californiensis]|uniref:HepT-like ribonuclease domain-containing protein n=1 Tax=Candidatus Protofrankia californiensis TaxID=1839754 RepID=UPI00104189B9|nr:DUF86 domain-containing protein [Candidatus Protofrankia californiensis]
MRRDELYLVDMLEAAKAVSAFLADVDERTFAGSDLLQSAVLQKLMVLGEAAGRVSLEVRDRWPEVPWRSVSGFRNLAVHAYFEIEWSIVWRIATVSLPTLRNQLTALVKAEFPLVADQLGQEN